MSLKILIVEDHAIVVLGTTLLIKQLFPAASIFKAESLDDTLEHLSKHTFDLMILDINIPGGTLTNMIELFRLRQQHLPILVQSSYNEASYALPFIKKGANGYVSKNAATEEIKKAITLVINKKNYISPLVQQQLLDNLQNETGQQNPFLTLTDREMEIMNLLAKGFSTNTISSMLNVQKNTVSTHKTKLYEKLGIKNAIELADKARLYLNDQDLD